jgi:ribonuclease HI
MRVGTHVLATFHAHTLLLSTRSEQLEPTSTHKTRTAPTGYILLLVGNDEGLRNALSISDELKTTLADRLAFATRSKSPPEMNWRGDTHTDEDTRITPHGTTVECKQLTRTTMFKRIYSMLPWASCPLNDENPNLIDDDDERDPMVCDDPTKTHDPTTPAQDNDYDMVNGTHNDVEIHAYHQHQLDEWKYTKNQRVIYTDGSKGDGPAGAGVLMIDKHNTHTARMFTFNGPQTITRAELFAIREAVKISLAETQDDTPVVIYTDSKVSLLLLRKWLHQPNLMRYHKHRKIVEEIISLAAHSLQPIQFRKVKSHIRVTGNEVADSLAKFATWVNNTDIEDWKQLAIAEAERIEQMIPPLTMGRLEAPIIDNSNEDKTDVVLLAHRDDTDIQILSEDELTRVCERDHLEVTINGDTAAHRFTRGLFTKMAKQTNLDEWITFPDLLHKLKLETLLSENELTTLKQHIANRVFTSNSHGHKKKRTDGYLNRCQAIGCDGTHNFDTAAHMRGQCTNKALHALYVQRHDAIVQLIVASMLHGTFGNMHITYDLGTTCSLGEATTRATIPHELFHGPQQVGQPDIVIIQDYHAPQDQGNYSVTAESRLNNTDKYMITLLDIHCVSDECKSDAAKARKAETLDKTATILRELPAGHNVEVIPITIGTRVPLVPSDIDTLQLQLGIGKEQMHKLFKDIWVCNAYFLRRIQTTYYKEQYRDAGTPSCEHAHAPLFPRRRRPNHNDIT